MLGTSQTRTGDSGTGHSAVQHSPAAKSAASYLERMSFSRSERIEQLVFDGFTQEQAEYGAAQNGD